MLALAAMMRPACVGALAGLGLATFAHVHWSAFAGLAVFYLMLVLQSGAKGQRGGSDRQ